MASLNKQNCPFPHIAWTAWSTHRLTKDEAIALGVHRPYDPLGDDTRYSGEYESPYISGRSLFVSGMSPSMGQLEFDWAQQVREQKPTNPTSMNLVPTRYDYGAVNSAYENTKQKQAMFCASNPLGQDCRNWTAARENMENQLSYGKIKLMGNELMPMPQAYRSNF